MKKEEVFFGKDGLTVTSANHICNLAKEMMRNVEDDIANIRFVMEGVRPIACEQLQIVHVGVEEKEFAQIEQKLEQIMELKSLIAWFREAIKAKEVLDKELRDMSRSKILEKLGITEEECKRVSLLTEDEHIATLSIGERNTIYTLQAKVATLGKAIHADGPLTKAREELHRIKRCPSTLDKAGVQNIVHSFEATMDEESVDTLYFKLQARHRELQSELNKHLHAISEYVKCENEQRNAQNMTLHSQFCELQRCNDEKIEAWRDKERHRISQLKIVIPQNLQDIFDKVNG